MIYLLSFSSGCSSCHPCSDSLHFRNLIRPIRPKIKGPLELSLDRSLPLAMVHMGLWDLLHVILSKTSRKKKMHESTFERGRWLRCICDKSS